MSGAGFDRIDNLKGYTPENSIPCCARCNSMKSGMGVLEFIERCYRIASRLHLVETTPTDWENARQVRDASIAINEAEEGAE
jgi:hypothetical protein